jgi:hypothetical protein
MSRPSAQRFVPILLLALLLALSWRSAAAEKAPRRQTPAIFGIDEGIAATGHANIRGYVFDRSEPPSIMVLVPQADKKEMKSLFVPLKDLDKHKDMTPAEQPYPLRLAVIAGSFPFKKQVAEFRRRLGLPSAVAVLQEKNAARDKEAPAQPAFRFLRVEVERREVDRGGKAVTKFAALPVSRDYRPWIILAGRRFEPENPELAPAIFPGLVMPWLRTFQDRRGSIEDRLLLLARTVKSLAARKDELPDHCLVRVIDVAVAPGTTYEYRLRIVMANPNYKRRDVANPADAEKAELKSDWSKNPIIAHVETEVHYYSVDQKDLQAGRDDEDEKKLYRGPHATENINKNEKVVLQAHRWFGVTPSRDGKELRLGEWAVAERIPVVRGEYVGRFERVEVPIWGPRRQEFAIATDGSKTKRRPGVDLWFGYESKNKNQPEAILIDFEGGRLVYNRTVRRPEDAPRIKQVLDEYVTQALLLNPEGRLMLLEGGDDTRDERRVRRLHAVRQRLREIRKAEKGDEKGKNPFGR